MATTSTEALVIGSGIGGLSMAVLLARSGFRVTVLEKNPLPGGMMRGFSRRGFECHVGIHYLGALGCGQALRRFLDFMGVYPDKLLERMGAGGIIDRYIFDDFTFDLPEGIDAYEHNLRAAFPQEGRQITGIVKLLRQAEKHLNSLDFLFSDPIAFEHPEQFQAIGEVMAQLGCSSGLKSVLSVPSCWIGVSPDRCPVFYHTMALAAFLMSAWRVKTSAGMVDAFVRRLESLGGRMVCGDGVESILVDSRTVRGVQTVSGREINAPLVIGTVHPGVVLAMLPAESVGHLYRRRISRLQNTQSILCVHAELDAAAHPEIPHNIFRIDRNAHGEILDLRYYQIRGQNDRSILSILTSGREEHWRRWETTRSGRRGRAYVEAKEQLAKKLLRGSEKILGPLAGCRLLDVYTPLTIRDWVNSPGGSAYGVMRSCDQLLSAARLNRTKVAGLFLAGQSVMAPGIMGAIMGSFQTLRFILGPERFRSQIALPFQKGTCRQ